MSFHTDYEAWVRMTDPQYCPVCRSEPMPPGMVDIVELPHSWLDAEPVDCLRGALPQLAYANLVFVWCSVQQLGFLMADGHFARPGPRLVDGVEVLAGILHPEVHATSPHCRRV